MELRKFSLFFLADKTNLWIIHFQNKLDVSFFFKVLFP